MNTNKTTGCLVGKRRLLQNVGPLKIMFGQDVIPFTSSIQIQRLIIDDNLSFTLYMEHVALKCKRILAMLWKLRISSLAARKTVAITLCFSILDYCNALLINIPDKNMKIYDRVVNSTVRYIYQVKPWIPTTQFLMSSHILPAKFRAKYKMLCLVKKALLNEAPNYIIDIIPKMCYPVYLRKVDDNFLIGEPNEIPKSMGKRSLYHASKEFNTLSYRTRSSKNIDIFKRLLKTELYIKAFEQIT